MSAIAQQLESIIGADSVQQWELVEPTVQATILPAVYPDARIDCIIYPKTAAELAEVMTCANRDRWCVLPMGSGSKLAWGGLATTANVVVSTARLNQLVDHAVGDLTVTAAAGIGFADLQAELAKAGQFLAIDPLYPQRATLGGIVATADAGALRQRYGGIRDMLIGVSIVRSDGQIAKAGGRVVKNVAGYDLMKLFTGSFGTLGIITQLTFRVYPLPTASQTSVLLGDPERLAQATQTLLNSALTPAAVELISPQTAAALGLEREMGLLVRFQSIPVSVKEQSDRLLQLGQTLQLKSITFTEADDTSLWHRLREQFESLHQESTTCITTCKLGVLPSNATRTLDKLSVLLPLGVHLIHAGSGLGLLRSSSDSLSAEMLLSVRQLCQEQGGFLTVLDAPVALKQQVDVWGYSGNALHLMQALKTQFDPHNVLSPHRFVNGI